jgi:hypothetical protein
MTNRRTASDPVARHETDAARPLLLEKALGRVRAAGVTAALKLRLATSKATGRSGGRAREPAQASILGIRLMLGNPRLYLSVLRHAVIRHYSEGEYQLLEDSAILRDIEAALGPIRTADSRASGAIGYSDPTTVGALVDREWLQGELNEFGPLADYLERKRILPPKAAFHVLGGGVCRLADWVAATATVRSVVCSDLSWLNLYFGRALIERKYDLLPGAFRRSRLHLSASEGCRQLVAEARPARFDAPHPQARGKVSFEVRDAFALGAPLPCDALCAFFLLDAFGEEQMESLLVRLAQSVANGQILVLATSAVAMRTGERDPRKILTILSACGFDAEFVDFVRIPYSFSAHDFATVTSSWNTLFLRATKVSDIDHERVRISPYLDAGPSRLQRFATGWKTAWRLSAFAPSEDCIHVLRECSSPRSYAVAKEALAGRIGLAAFDQAIGTLTAAAALKLSVE